MAFTANCAYCDVPGDTLPLRSAYQCNFDGKVPRDITNCLNHYHEKRMIREERKGDDLVKVQLWFYDVNLSEHGTPGKYLPISSFPNDVF